MPETGSEPEERWASNELGRLRVVEDDVAPGEHLERTFEVESTSRLTNPDGWIVQRIAKEYRGVDENGTPYSYVAVEHEAFEVNAGKRTTAQREDRRNRSKPDDEFVRTEKGNLVRGSVLVTATAQFIEGATIPTDWGSKFKDSPHFRTSGQIELEPGQDPNAWFDQVDFGGTPGSGKWMTEYEISWDDTQ